jgi:hypothetical protein
MPSIAIRLDRACVLTYDPRYLISMSMGHRCNGVCDLPESAMAIIAGITRVNRVRLSSYQ